MSFLTPFFLLGGLAIAGPILFHLIRRTTRERMPFSSLMFLTATPPRLTRKSRIENWLLLLLRCLALALMAFGFARPFLQHPPVALDTSGPRKRIVLLVDTSASMRRADLWSAARQQAESVAREAGAGDEVALLTFGRSTELLVSFEDWQRAPTGERAALVTGRLAGREPGWMGTHLGAALIRAGDLLAEASNQEAPGVRRIVLISDLQAGSHMEALQAYEWPKEVELVVLPVAPKTLGNATLQWLPDAGENDSGATNQVRIRISNAGDTVRDRFEVGWAASASGTGFQGKPLEVVVPAGQNRTLALAVPTNGPATQVLLSGDDQPFDNRVHVVPPEQVRSTVMYWGSERIDDPRQPAFFLGQALPTTRRQAVELQLRSPSSPVVARELEVAALYVVRDVLPEATVAALRERVLGGKVVVLVLKNSGMAATAARLLGLEALALEEATVKDYAMLENIDFRHPCFAPFADPRFSDFTRIHFWKYRRVPVGGIPGARVVAGLDSGDPALVEVPVGRGRVLILASGWHPEDSQWALSTKFVPFVFSLLEMSGGAVSTAGQTIVGEPAPVPGGFGAGLEGFLQGPSGAPVSLGIGVTNVPAVEQPGLHVLRAGQEQFRFAANLDPLESRTVPLSLDELERWGAPVRHPTVVVSPVEQARAKQELQSQEAEGRQKLWRWFVVATLAVLLGETVLAGWATRQVTAGASA